MKCRSCGNAEPILGTLEGVSFVPCKEEKKVFATGVYGITASVCPECGLISNFRLDAETLKKILKKDLRSGQL